MARYDQMASLARRDRDLYPPHRLSGLQDEALSDPKDRTDEVLAAVGSLKDSIDRAQASVENMRSQNSAEHGKFEMLMHWTHTSIDRILARLGFLRKDPP